jgi:hypothetical protein
MISRKAIICSVERMTWDVISSVVAVGFESGSLNGVGGYVAAILQKGHGGGAFESIFGMDWIGCSYSDGCLEILLSI